MKTLLTLLLLVFTREVIFGQANTTLSNLTTPTAINQSLVPNSSTRDLGSSTFRWDDLFVAKLNLTNISLRQGTSANGNLLASNSTVSLGVGFRNTGFGFGGGSLLSSSSLDNTFFGFEAGMSSSSTQKSTYFGSKAGRLNTASHCTFIGAESGLANTTGAGNTFLGHSAGSANTTGSDNVAIGHLALRSSVSAYGNVAIGQGSGFSNTGNSNVFIGRSAGISTVDGDSNVLIGSGTGGEVTSGDYNTFVGHDAGVGISTGSYNMAFGFQCEFLSGSINSSMVIGNWATVAISNAMVFGGSQQSKWGFGNSLASATASQALIVGTSSGNGNGAFLTTGGTWTNTSSKSLKEEIQKIDGTEILDKINHLELSRWKYAGTNEYHIGPMAEEFYKVFNVGVDDKSISTIDPAGVALVAIQALSGSLEEIQVENARLDFQNQSLQLQLDEVRVCLERMCDLEKKLETYANGVSSLIMISPNPVSDQLTARCFISADTRNASLLVHSMNGQIIRTIDINERGHATLVVDVSGFAPGTYTCTLLADGIATDSQLTLVAR